MLLKKVTKNGSYPALYIVSPYQIESKSGLNSIEDCCCLLGQCALHLGVLCPAFHVVCRL